MSKPKPERSYIDEAEKALIKLGAKQERKRILKIIKEVPHIFKNKICHNWLEKEIENGR